MFSQPFLNAIALEGRRSVYMNANQYLLNLLRRETVNVSPQSPVRGVISVLRPLLLKWGNKYLAGILPSGSFAKGTAIHSGTDIDIFVSLRPDTVETLGEIYQALNNALAHEGYKPKKQNVSINVRVNGYDVDVVPGKRQSAWSSDHSLYRHKADTWTKTNIARHINLIHNSRRLNEIRIIKLWRNQKGLDFPSFYLELTVLAALKGKPFGKLSENVRAVLEYLRDSFEAARVVDPANTNNVISDDLNSTEKAVISFAATIALSGSWADMVS